MTAPASRRRATRKASAVGELSARASEPAEFVIPTASMLSLSSTGMPCIGPRTLPALRSASRRSASASAAGFSSMIEFSVGPAVSMPAMRAR
jgi:hypothetical protein